MGTICAPAHANIFMAEFEQEYIYRLIKDKSILFLRYIDHIFMVWTKPEKTAKRFYEWTESETSLYKVWLQIYCKLIEFLDTLV